ncbi:MAG: SDR family oxidoreductase [Saprospiraceae bacterium]|nr:SDR family oxidoreductase [Saprospiraceae bacterium]
MNTKSDKSPDAFNLSGKVAIITGSSKGIGASIAKTLAEHGASVVISSRKQKAVDKLAEELQSEGLNVKACECHVGQKADLEKLVNFAKEEFGGVDILVNNAGINPVYAPLSEMSDVAYEKIMNVNLKACLMLSNLCYPIMKERGGGSVINISSVEGLKTSPGLSVYSISKAGLNMLTQCQAREWGQDNIRANAICPGLIQTKLSSAIWQNESVHNAFIDKLPLKRIAQPEEISNLALFLASEASSYCTGSIITADGGYMLAG